MVPYLSVVVLKSGLKKRTRALCTWTIRQNKNQWFERRTQKKGRTFCLNIPEGRWLVNMRREEGQGAYARARPARYIHKMRLLEGQSDCRRRRCMSFVRHRRRLRERRRRDGTRGEEGPRWLGHAMDAAAASPSASARPSVRLDGMEVSGIMSRRVAPRPRPGSLYCIAVILKGKVPFQRCSTHFLY